MFGVPLPVFGLSMIFSIALCVHAVRTHQQLYWLWIILAFQPLGGIVYLIAVAGPDLMGGKTARAMGKAARETLDPGRAWRLAKVAYDDAPTVQNTMKLAEAASSLGRWDEAETLYQSASQGMYAEDPVLLLGRARALMELSRPGEALEVLQPLLAAAGQVSPQALLIQGRACQALGRYGEAERAYAAAVVRVPGVVGLARPAALFAEIGRTEDARTVLADIEKRTAKTRAHFRREAKAWRDFAADRIAAGSRAA
jgi:hypothetical protein